MDRDASDEETKQLLKEVTENYRKQPSLKLSEMEMRLLVGAMLQMKVEVFAYKHLSFAMLAGCIIFAIFFSDTCFA